MESIEDIQKQGRRISWVKSACWGGAWSSWAGAETMSSPR